MQHTGPSPLKDLIFELLSEIVTYLDPKDHRALKLTSKYFNKTMNSKNLQNIFQNTLVNRLKAFNPSIAPLQPGESIEAYFEGHFKRLVKTQIKSIEQLLREIFKNRLREHERELQQGENPKETPITRALNILAFYKKEKEETITFQKLEYRHKILLAIKDLNQSTDFDNAVSRRLAPPTPLILPETIQIIEEALNKVKDDQRTIEAQKQSIPKSIYRPLKRKRNSEKQQGMLAPPLVDAKPTGPVIAQPGKPLEQRLQDDAITPQAMETDSWSIKNLLRYIPGLSSFFGEPKTKRHKSESHDAGVSGVRDEQQSSAEDEEAKNQVFLLAFSRECEEQDNQQEQDEAYAEQLESELNADGRIRNN